MVTSLIRNCKVRGIISCILFGGLFLDVSSQTVSDAIKNEKYRKYCTQKSAVKTVFPGKINKTLEVTFFIYATDSADFKSIRNKYLDKLDSVNAAFEQIGLSFRVCESRMIKDCWFYPCVCNCSVMVIPAFVDMYNIYANPGTINMYFLNSIAVNCPDEYDTEGMAEMPFGEDNLYFNYNIAYASTMIHELGHFFGLEHTHDTEFGVEFVDGSNCTTAGDLICDTPADFNLGSIELNNDCTYDYIKRDGHGDVYVPSAANHMSYAPGRCRCHFTPEQYKKMVEMYYVARSHLR